MPAVMAFVARSLLWTLLFGAGLDLLRVAHVRPAAPIAGLFSVAVAAGVTLEVLRWMRGRYAGQVGRRTVGLVAGVAAAIWAFGLWVDLHSADRGALVIGGTIAAAATVYAYWFLPNYRGI